jgi:metal-dependent amidase/aminoacylase/carboxypeptidase family protein
MPIINRIADFHPEMTQWRHQIHAHPETAFEEHKTATFVAERLKSFGLTVECGIAGTGVIGTLRGSAEGRHAIALRADMDALHIAEQNAFPMLRRSAGGCTPAVTMAIPRCCSAPQSISQRRVILPEPSISSSSRRRRTKAGRGS